MLSEPGGNTGASSGVEVVDLAPEEVAKKSRDHYWPTLDGWRAIAIMLVLAMHGRSSLAGPHGFFPAEHVYYAFSHCWIGVQLFFGISGFIITRRMLEEHQATGSVSLKSFYLRRAFRILPPALLYLGVVWGLQQSGAFPSSPPGLWGALLFCRNYIGTDYATSHFWSLSVEEHFYLLWPLLLLMAGWRRGVRPALALILFSAVVRALWNAWGIHYTFHTETEIDGLAAGCLGAFLVDNRYFSRLLGSVGDMGVLLLFVVFVWTSIYGPATVFHLLPAVLVCCTVVRPGSVVSRGLEHRTLTWIGRLSYSIYIWQMLFLVWFSTHPDHVWEAFPLNFVLLAGCALLSHHAVERPLMRVGRQLAARWGGWPGGEGVATNQALAPSP